MQLATLDGVSTAPSSQIAPIGAISSRSFGRRGAHMSYSLIAKFYELTGSTDGHIARLLGMPRSTVQAFRTGKLNEKLTEAQRERLVEAARSYRQEVYEMVAEIELLS